MQPLPSFSTFPLGDLIPGMDQDRPGDKGGNKISSCATG